MSSVDKLQIRGIRSFSPNRDETIEFYSPLTMIVGANGCGKTTIIECLKMACTGNLPPTCSQGQSFVNDPGMTNTTEVKAHIKLRFNNQAGYPTVVARSFQVTKKKSQIQFKSLDGTIRLTDAEGRRESISQKCADLDKQMPELLGIAAPILDNVVFCHQEESAWPLQEGATLKKKFDDIFDSTRYTKALESITKTKKDLQSKGKDLKADVAELGAHLQTSSMIKKELKSFELKVKSCQDEINTLQERESELQEKISQINKEIRLAEQEEQKLIELRRQVSDLDRRATEKEESLETVYTESDSRLKNLVDDFDNVTNSRTIERNQLKQTERSFQQTIKDKRERLGILQSRRGEAFALQQDLELKKQEELVLIQRMAETFDLTIPSIPSNETFTQRSQRVELFLRQVDEKINLLNQDGAIKISKAVKELETVQKKTKQAQLNLQQLILEISNDDKELSRIDKERQTIRAELNNYDTLSQRNARPQAESDVKQATEELETFNSTISLKRMQINDERRKIDDEIRDLTESITSDNRLLQDLSFYRAENERIEAQLRHSEQDILNCESDANIASMKYHHIIEKYCNNNTNNSNNVNQNITSTIKKLTNLQDLELIVKYLSGEGLQTQKNQTKLILEQAEGIRKEIAMIQATVEMDRRRKLILQSELEQLRQAEITLENCMNELNSMRYTDNNEEMYPILNDIEDLDFLLEVCSAAERATAETCMALDSSKLWRDRISKKSRQKIPEGRNFIRRCPCCDKGMTSDEAIRFDNNIDDLFKSNLATDELIKRASDMYSRIKEISAKITSSVSIARGFNAQRTELNQINLRLSGVEDKIDILRHQEGYLSDEIEQNRKNELELEKCILELSTLYSQWFSSLQKLEEIKLKKIRQLNLVTPGGDLGGRSIADIEESLRHRNDNKQNLQTKRSRLDEDLNRLERQLLALTSSLSDKKQVLMEINHRMTKASELEEKLRELESNERLTISNKSTKLREKSNQERNIIKIESEEKSEKEVYKRLEDSIRENSNNWQNARNRLVTATKAHLTIAKRCEEVNLEQIDRELDSMKSEILSIERSITDLQPKITLLDNQINQQEHTKKVIMDNITARTIRQEATELFTKLHEIESKIASEGGNRNGNLSLQELSRQLQKYIQNKQSLEKDRHNLTGRMNTLVEQIDIQEKKLNTPTYKNIDDRFRKKNIEYETTLLAVSDLESYYQALDTALQKFHTLRVDEINKSIKELWQLAYRGGDIDTIEIVSGDEGASGRALKSYNYRVVMRKGDIPLDMRGRCSAGQRVLASIVIRLALAEAFCVSCGILALDEPTTNLDEAHKSGLAHALSRIISNRAQQQNFQLIVITHDEEFVKLMNMELSTMTDFAPPESYFRISRQEEGMSGKFFSHIEKIPWDDL